MQAIEGAKAMLRRMDALNDRLAGELSEPLKIGVGINAGEAIVGSMGPPATPIVSALGDNVNIAARLESQTKEYGVPLVISAHTAEYAGIDLTSLVSREVPVKGRDRPIRVYTISDPDALVRSEA
jgi:adenylate cyclase